MRGRSLVYNTHVVIWFYFILAELDQIEEGKDTTTQHWEDDWDDDDVNDDFSLQLKGELEKNTQKS